MGEEEDGPKARARSRSPGYDVTNFLCTFIEGGEASSVGYGQKAVKMHVYMPWPQSGQKAVKMHVYMPWPQSGRTQYEEIKDPGLTRNIYVRAHA
jgi:hypothetical protein